MSVRADLDLAELVGLDSGHIRQRIEAADHRVSVSFSMPDTYHSMSKAELALSALKGWYIGERVAEFCSSVRSGVDEGVLGEGLFIFHAEVLDAVGLAGFLADIAPAFDPDDLEAEAELGAEAEGWLENRGAAPARLPALEEAYRVDAEQAAESVDESDA